MVLEAVVLDLPLLLAVPLMKVLPIDCFPRTTKASLDIVSDLLENPRPEYAGYAIHHGIYLAKKLRNVDLENHFVHMEESLKNTSGNKPLQISFTDTNLPELFNRIKQDVMDSLKNIPQSYYDYPELSGDVSDEASGYASPEGTSLYEMGSEPYKAS